MTGQLGLCFDTPAEATTGKNTPTIFPEVAAPAPPTELSEPGAIALDILSDLKDATSAFASVAAGLGTRQPARPSRASQAAARADEAAVRSPLEILATMARLDRETDLEIGALAALLVPKDTPRPGLPTLTAGVLDGAAILTCEAGTAPLALVLERLSLADPTGFVLLAGIAAEIAAGAALEEDPGGGMFARSIRRVDLEIEATAAQHAIVLGCTPEELPERLEAERLKKKAVLDAERAKSEEARVEGPVAVEAGAPLRAKGRAATTATAPVDIQAAAHRRLTQRQIELIRMINVVGDRAIYGDGKETRIPDWANVKSTVVTLGGTWQPASSKGPAGFRFAEGVDVAEVIRLAQDTGEIFDARVVGFFPTPWGLARTTARRLGILPGWRVLEPSAGSGRLAVAARELGAAVFCIEPLAVNRSELLGLGLELVGEDFLATDPASLDPFDAVLQNPPFANDAAVIHTLHAARFVRAGGPVVTIAPNDILEHSTGPGPRLRAFLAAHGGTVEKLPEGAFLESGTGVHTCVLTFATCARCRSGACVPA